jgi:hypothetical protein
MGKGSKDRTADRDQYKKNYDQIEWGKKKKIKSQALKELIEKVNEFRGIQ